MFHYKDNLFFGRRANGAVRVLRLPATPVEPPRVDDPAPEARFDFTIDPAGWASIVASVSARGEENGRFYMAQDFHAGEPVRPEVA